MKTILKRALILAYCHELMTLETCQRIYDRLNLAKK
jgi:hypothetical protein